MGNIYYSKFRNVICFNQTLYAMMGVELVLLELSGSESTSSSKAAQVALV
jgi:hypothetical protein